MVVIPFSIYNIRTTTRKFSNESYQYIIKGVPKKNGAKADYGFFDSLLNVQVKPNKESSGYIRIPFDGCGKYGIRFNYGYNNKQSITSTFNRIPNAPSIPENKEFMNKTKPIFNKYSKKTAHRSKKTTHIKTIKLKKGSNKTTDITYLKTHHLLAEKSASKYENPKQIYTRIRAKNNAVLDSLKTKKSQKGKRDWTDRFALK